MQIAAACRGVAAKRVTHRAHGGVSLRTVTTTWRAPSSSRRTPDSAITRNDGTLCVSIRTLGRLPSRRSADTATIHRHEFLARDSYLMSKMTGRGGRTCLEFPDNERSLIDSSSRRIDATSVRSPSRKSKKNKHDR